MWNIILNIFAVLGGIVTVVTIVTAILHWLRLKAWKKQITWDDALRNAKRLLEQIQNYHKETGWMTDIVIGLGRSGGIWGGWLAGNLGSLPFAVVDDKYELKGKGLEVDFPGGEEILTAIRKTYPDKKRILVVEGATATGKTPSKFTKKFSNVLKDCDVKYAVIYKNPGSSFDMDFVGKIGPEPWPAKLPWQYTDLYRPYLRDIFRN
jgi:hypoxanthine phosphoribosyltransferase